MLTPVDPPSRLASARVDMARWAQRHTTTPGPGRVYITGDVEFLCREWGAVVRAILERRKGTT